MSTKLARPQDTIELLLNKNKLKAIDIKMSDGTDPACRWNDKLYYDGDHWKENGVDFFCTKSSHESHRVRPGCYVESRRVKCTGAIAGKFILGYQSIHLRANSRWKKRKLFLPSYLFLPIFQGQYFMLFIFYLLRSSIKSAWTMITN